MTIIYKITLDNYQGEHLVELFHHSKNAHARFNELWEENKNKDEFEGNKHEMEMSFFDPMYNEYSTYIVMCACTLDSLFEDQA